MKLRILVIFFTSLLFLSGCQRQESLITESQKKVSEQFVSKKASEKITPPAAVNKNVKNMSFEEALEAKHYYERIGDMQLVLKALRRMKETTTEIEKMAALLIEIGDLEMALGNYEQAQLIYREFKVLYPGNENLRHILYQEMLAHLFEKLDGEHDQSKTQEILALSEQFLQEFGADDAFYATRVGTIIQDCYKTLIEHELRCINFYLHKFSYTYRVNLLIPVKRRLEYIRKELLVHLIPFDNSLMTIDKMLATVLENAQEWHLESEKQEKKQEEILEAAQESVAIIKAVQEGEKIISHSAEDQQAIAESKTEELEQARILQKAVQELEYALYGLPEVNKARDTF
ncbi:MAG: outer membrane protein assembly factor BamD [Candidatus Babeliaceae bacterium]